VDLRVSRPAAPVEFRCRPVEISQVLVNLLNNAFDAAKLTPSEQPWVEIRVEDQPSRLKIAVLDSGAGVARENRDKIMQPFFSTKELGKGTGLGLSVSKGIIESHGGFLEFRDDLPHTCFEVSIPK
jgi:signal transduction histidine kinase